MRALLCVFLCLFCLTFVNSCLFFKWRPFNQKPHLAALILARGGSKGIRYKNLAKVGNKTLLNIAITEIKKSKGFNSIWVSTDNWKIFEEAKKDKVNIYWRSRKSATDTATSISAVQEFLKDQTAIDNVALIQCTSPFIKSNYLNIAIENIKHYECVFSVTRWVKISGVACCIKICCSL